jgi:hypothetical protein
MPFAKTFLVFAGYSIPFSTFLLSSRERAMSRCQGRFGQDPGQVDRHFLMVILDQGMLGSIAASPLSDCASICAFDFPFSPSHAGNGICDWSAIFVNMAIPSFDVFRIGACVEAEQAAGPSAMSQEPG